MFLPRATLCVEVVKLRNESIERRGKARFRSDTRFELLPKPSKLLFLIRRQQPKNAICSAAFTVSLVILGVIDICVAGIDFDDVVNEHHLDDFTDLEGFIGVLGQHHRQQREMPTVLGGIFTPAAIYQVSAPVNALQLVELKDEVKLPRQSIHAQHSTPGGDFLHASRKAKVRQPPAAAQLQKSAGILPEETFESPTADLLPRSAEKGFRCSDPYFFFFAAFLAVFFAVFFVLDAFFFVAVFAAEVFADFVTLRAGFAIFLAGFFFAAFAALAGLAGLAALAFVFIAGFAATFAVALGGAGLAAFGRDGGTAGTTAPSSSDSSKSFAAMVKLTVVDSSSIRISSSSPSSPLASSGSASKSSPRSRSSSFFISELLRSFDSCCNRAHSTPNRRDRTPTFSSSSRADAIPAACASFETSQE